MTWLSAFLIAWRDGIFSFFRDMWNYGLVAWAGLLAVLGLLWTFASALVDKLGPLLKTACSSLLNMMPTGYQSSNFPDELLRFGAFCNSFLPLSEIAYMFKLLIALELAILAFKVGAWVFGKIFAVGKAATGL